MTIRALPPEGLLPEIERVVDPGWRRPGPAGIDRAIPDIDCDIGDRHRIDRHLPNAPAVRAGSQQTGGCVVVDTGGFNEEFWIVRAGLLHTEALHLTERISSPDFNTLKYEATIDDPRTYTRPWTGGWYISSVHNQDFEEYFCQDNNRDGSHGREVMRASLIFLGCLWIAASVPTQEGHPLSGTWHGTWGPNEKDRIDVTLVMNWDGSLSGILNPGLKSTKLQKMALEASSWGVHFETDLKDKSGATVHVVADGKIEDFTNVRRGPYKSAGYANRGIGSSRKETREATMKVRFTDRADKDCAGLSANAARHSGNSLISCWQILGTPRWVKKLEGSEDLWQGRVDRR